jgi:hypothetical protein
VAAHKTLKNILLYLSAVITILIILVIFLERSAYHFNPWKNEEAQLKCIKIGMAEKQVADLLGEPTWKFTTQDGEDYYIPGHSIKRRKITNKVYLFGKADMILYVWFDKYGFVEDIFLARS